MKLYMQYITMQIKSQMQYKVSFLLSAFGQFLSGFTFFFGIRFIFAKITRVDTFSYGHVLLCYAIVRMAFAIGEMFGGGLAFFPNLLRSGELDRVVVRPRSVILQVLAPNTDFTRLGILIQAIVILCYAVPISGIRWTGIKVFVLLWMILGGSVLFFCLFLVSAAVSFFTIEAMDFMNVFTYGAREFGRFPVSVYGESVLKFLTFAVPLALFQYYPLLYLIDQDKGIFGIIAPILSLLFAAPSYAFYQYAFSKYQSVGS